MRGLALALAVAGCGRIGFEAQSDATRTDTLVPDPDASPLVCPSFAMFCDDFESNTTAKWDREEIMPPGAMLMVSGERRYSGLRALDADVPALINGAQADVSLDIPLQSTGVVATRMWIYAVNMFTLYDGVLRMGYLPTNQYVIVSCSSTDEWVATERSDATGIVDHHSGVPCGPNAWSCVELVYSLTARRMTLYIDSTMVFDVAVQDPAPQFSRIDVGAVRADATGFRVFVDDVAFANQRIGCQ